jgi:hypothetical protein
LSTRKEISGIFYCSVPSRVHHGIPLHRDTLEGTVNAGAHSKFATKWLDKLEAEKPAPAVVEEAEAPTAEATA